MGVYIKPAWNTIKRDKEDFSIHFARSAPVFLRKKKKNKGYVSQSVV